MSIILIHECPANIHLYITKCLYTLYWGLYIIFCGRGEKKGLYLSVRPVLGLNYIIFCQH